MNAPAPAALWEQGRRILLLAAHPDDEVVGCCAAIGRARAAGAEVSCLMLTTGIPAREVLWLWARYRHAEQLRRRRDEACAAAGLIGLSAPEYLDNGARQLRSCMADVRARIQELIARLQIDTVWAPAYEGGHADHDCANAIAASLADAPALQLYEYAEYNNAGGVTHTQTFPAPNGAESLLWLTARETELKVRALALYRSAQGDLGYVETRQECFRPLARYDYSQPPHPGTLFYQRYQWVFFRHPRVDFTRPEDVCRDLASFQETLRQATAKKS